MFRRSAPAAVTLGAAVVLAACSSAEPADGDLAVTGGFGDKPEITIPAEAPSAELAVDVLVEGDGPEVQAGDLLVVNYLGQTWDPRPADEVADLGADATEPDPDGNVPFVFDNSYDRGEPANFPIGTGAVIAGWDDGLVGQRAGSRVLLVIPPEQGYGDSEGHDLQDDTLVFVVDIIGSYGEDLGVSGEPVGDLPDDLPDVTGEGAEQPVVEFPGSAEPVGESDATVVVAGDGEEIPVDPDADPVGGAPGPNLVVQALQVSYLTGETQFSTWDASPLVIRPETLPGLTEALDGHGVGSRVLVRIAAQDNVTEQEPEGEPVVIVVDVIGTF